MADRRINPEGVLPTSRDSLTSSSEKRAYERRRKEELEGPIRDIIDNACRKMKEAFPQRALTNDEEEDISKIMTNLNEERERAASARDGFARNFYDKEINNLEEHQKEYKHKESVRYAGQEIISSVEKEAIEATKGTPTQQKREDIDAFKTFASDGLAESLRENRPLAAEFYRMKVEDADKLLKIMECRILVESWKDLNYNVNWKTKSAYNKFKEALKNQKQAFLDNLQSLARDGGVTREAILQHQRAMVAAYRELIDAMKGSQRMLQEFGRSSENQGGSELNPGSVVDDVDRAIEIRTGESLVNQWKALNSGINTKQEKAYDTFRSERLVQGRAFQYNLQSLARDGDVTREAILPVIEGHQRNKVGFYSDLIDATNEFLRRLQEFGRSLENQGRSGLQP